MFASLIARLKRWHWNRPAAQSAALLQQLLVLARNQHQLAVDDYLRRHVLDSPAYADPRRLARYERQVYSQYGEDGVLAEIFRRVGTSARPYFVEFGASTGLENNAAFLVESGWRGLWFEPDAAAFQSLSKSYRDVIASGAVTARMTAITADNVERLFAEAAVPPEPDLLSIDIDSNDYWVWKAISSYSPRVAVIEYNAIWPPGVEWIMPHDLPTPWDGASRFGASLSALTALATAKGYSLVGCTISGVNAFFVRNDLLGEHFTRPNDAAFHYEPARYHLTTTFGHRRRRL